MKFFVAFVLVLAFFDGTFGAIERIDELAKKFGQDPIAVRKKMIEVINELESSANAALDQAHDGTRKAGDLLQKGMLSVLEMARKFLESKSDQYNGVLNKGEEFILSKIAEFQQSLLSTQTTGRSGKQDLSWEIIYRETKNQIETVENIINDSQVDAKYRAQVDNLKQKLEKLNEQNANAINLGESKLIRAEYVKVHQNWFKLTQKLVVLGKEITENMK
ncbi:uncharacterized protein LOC141854625 [Brevipalpus obovatus]|uniref:uncharacterized protein LOC141854625 n=1 Tax=Brevipalpus obovatus TaxID=246614 RepID=UPI003D9E49AA